MSKFVQSEISNSKEFPTRNHFKLPLNKLSLMSFLILFLAFAFHTQLLAQTTITIGTGTTAGYSAGPIYRSSASSAYDASRYSYLYTPSELNIPAGAVITKIAWDKTTAFTSSGGAIFDIYMKNSAETSYSAASIPWATVINGATKVYTTSTLAFTAATGWIDFPVTPFTYTGGSLEVSTDWDINSVAGNPTSAAFSFAYSSVVDRIYGVSNTTTPTTALSSTTNSINSLDDQRPNIQITYLSSPCTAPPTPGQAVTSIGTVCPNTDFQLSLTGASNGLGLTYQWQISTNGTTGWTNITGATTSNVTISQSVSSFYRAELTCSGQQAYSTPVQVITNATPVSGTFNINKNLPASATNFTSISAAIASIECGGANGPIIFNVAANSGPYNEQVVLPVIPGVSAANTITFNGNGNTISATPAGTHLGVVTFNGADHVKFDNFIIALDAAATTGWGIQLKNASNNATISNCTINLPLTSTSIGVNGIIAGSATTTAGANTSNSKFLNNTINGGYYALQLNGSTGGADAMNNEITGNTFKDCYLYNIYLNNTDGNLVENNDISRPTRTGVSTFYGVYLSGSTKNSIVSKNRLHNTNDVATSLTTASYIFYLTATPAAGSENIFKNNLAYNLNNTGGTIYGIYHSSGSGAYFYHNAFALGSATHTAGIYGYQTFSAVTNTKLLNNIFTINGTGSTLKYGIYIGSTTAAIESNYNDIFVFPGVTSGNVGYYTSARVTLADWQTAKSNAYDQNSVSDDPGFNNIATGNLQPTSGVLNNIGQPLAAVTDDFTGAARNAATPDLGAYEFSPAADDVAVTAVLTPNSGTCGATAAETVSITVKNVGAQSQSNIPVSYQIGTNTPVTATVPGPIASGASLNFTFPVTANLSAGGTFTITASTSLIADTNPNNNTTTKTITVINPITAFPHIQDFQSSTVGAPGILPNGWTTSPATGYRWEIEDGQPTSGTTTGPAADHTTGVVATSKYVYTESSTGATGDISYLNSPCIDISALTSPGFDFWYHMHGATTGTMEAQVSNNNGTTWTTLSTLTGPQQTAATDPWLKKTVSLAGYSGIIQIRFKGTRGSSFTSDMAIDDIKIYNIPANDLEVLSLTLPSSGCNIGAAETICITVKNNGTTAVSNFPVSYTINGGTPVVETATITVAPNANGQYCFTTKANLSAPNTYTIVGTALLTGDGDPSNDTKTGTVTSSPNISTFPYSQNFENGAGGWISGGTLNSWALGTPAKPIINSAASGTKAWVTGLTAAYNNSEQSFVVGPCFNFGSIADPDFEMKIWWNAEFSWDGAVLQSSINGGTTWQNVGAMGDPNNWYTDNTINGGPGGQPGATAQGWSGRASTSNGSGGWVLAKHKLTGLGGQSSVLLRIAFASDGTGIDDGFAFDDVRIGDNTGNLAVNAFTPLTKVCGFGSNEPVQVTIENLGSVPASGFTMSYTVNGGTPVTENFAGSLAPGTPTAFTFATPANLSSPGAYTIVVTLNSANDPELVNNSVTYSITNASFASIPPAFDFETVNTGIGAMRTISASKATLTESAAASNGSISTKGMLMAGVTDAAWQLPVGAIDPWTSNLTHLAGAYICFNPSVVSTDSLWLTFELKQLFKTANANTNFRVTVDGQQVGTTYRPPFSGGTAVWMPIKIDLTPYKNLSNIQVGLESSVSEEYANGAGTANLVDNVKISFRTGVKDNYLQSQLSVYPNPSAGLFTISLPKGKTYQLEVTDMTGKVIKTQNGVNGENILNLNGTAKGIYLLKVSSANGMAVRKLIID